MWPKVKVRPSSVIEPSESEKRSRGKTNSKVLRHLPSINIEGDSKEMAIEKREERKRRERGGNEDLL